jgi:hypothetical protein
MVSGGSSGPRERTTYGPDGPLLLEAATYELTAWWADRDGTPIGEGRMCETTVTVASRDEVFLSADFGRSGPCEFSNFSEDDLSRF